MVLQFVEPAAEDTQVRAAVYRLLQELRPNLTFASFEELLAEGPAQGLRVLLACDGKGLPVGAALYRILATSRGRVLFVDDLVTTVETRSAGFGGQLFAELERRGRDAGCVRIELDSGMTNQAAHRFYYRQRMGAIALHFAKPLGP